MRKLISKIALWMVFASTMAIPQAFAGSVELTASATTINAGDTVTVQVTDVGVDGGAVLTVGVDFIWGDDGITEEHAVCMGTLVDDGTYTYTCDASHQYSTAGDYVISAEVSEYDGDMVPGVPTSRTLSISVLPLPLVVEAGVDQSIYTGQTISIYSTSTGGDGSLDWAQVEWNDGSMYDFYNALPAGDLLITPIHTYTSAGIYTITVSAFDGITTSSDTFTVTVTDMPLPDLIVSELEYDADTDMINYTLMNQGGEIAEDTEGVTQFYYDGVEGSSYLWSWYYHTYFLSAGGSSEFVSSVIPEGASTVTVCIDDSNSVIESNEDNNCMSISLLPDLAVEITGYDEASGILNYTVSNNGTTDIDYTTIEGVNYVTVTNLDGTSAFHPFLWSYASDTNFLSAGGSSSFAFSTDDSDPDDISTMTVCADATSLVTESNEDNNCMSLSLLPDLTVEITGYDDVNGVLDYTVSNDGLTSVDTSTEGVNRITITNLDGTEVTHNYSWNILGSLNFLSAGGSSDFSIGDEASDSSNIYMIEVCTDATELVTENSEQNNCATRVINERPLVDLAPTGISASTIGVLSYSLSNLGTDNLTQPSVTTITIDGTTVLTDSPELTSDGAFMVAGGTSTIGVTTFSAYGIYQVTVCVDTNNGIYETNEGNNCISALVNYADPSTGGDTDGGNTGGGSSSTPAPTYGGGAGYYGSHSNSSSSSSFEGEQEVIVTEEGSTTEEDERGEMPFTDVNPNASYYDAIYNAWCEGIVRGRTPTSFAPSETILRGEVAKVVALTFGYTPVTSLDPTTLYTDIDPNQDLSPYILSLTEGGVLDGYADGTFKYAQGMTVTEIETLLANVLGTAVDASAYSDDGVTVTRGRFMEFIAQYK